MGCVYCIFGRRTAVSMCWPGNSDEWCFSRVRPESASPISASVLPLSLSNSPTGDLCINAYPRTAVMTLLESPFISTLLALAATFLLLAVLVEIIQEFYKFLTSSKSRAYTIVLRDFLGPWANELLRPGVFPDPKVRGPFQWVRLSPKGKMLPMKKGDLVSAMESTLPLWVQRVLSQLNVEAGIQAGKPDAPSASWKKLLTQIGNVERGTSGFMTATEIAGFLEIWGHTWEHTDLDAQRAGRKRRPSTETTSGRPVKVGVLRASGQFDAARTVKAFRSQFLSHVDTAADRFPVLEENYEYSYQRRNIRHCFVIAMLLALACNLPFEELYRKASGLSVEQATRLAEQALAIEAQAKKDSLSSADRETVQRLVRVGKDALAAVGTGGGTLGRVNYVVDREFISNLWKQGWWESLRYLFGCLATALLVSFGAPFWNDLTSLLLRIQKSRVNKKEGDENG
jgi:hypothetical protein